MNNGATIIPFFRNPSNTSVLTSLQRTFLRDISLAAREDLAKGSYKNDAEKAQLETVRRHAYLLDKAFREGHLSRLAADVQFAALEKLAYKLGLK